jgi:tetratricopeptide (TPR) repeat protein
MNQDRYQAYLELIEQLLRCPIGTEAQWLATQSELMDWELVDTVSQMIQERSQHLGTDPSYPQLHRLKSLLTTLQHHPLLTVKPSDAVIQLKTKQDADRLFRQGVEYYQTSQFKVALKTWQQALGLYQEIGDFQGEANVLSNLGVALQSLGQYQQAIEHYQQSLVVQRESGDWQAIEPETCHAPERLVTVTHHSQGEYRLAMKLAVDHFEKHLLLAESIGDRLGEAQSLLNLGKAYYALGQYEVAIACYQRSLTLRHSIQAHQGAQDLLFLLGQAYDALHDYSGAIEHYENYRQTASSDPTPDPRLYDVCVGLANAHYCCRQYSTSLQTYQDLLTLSQHNHQDRYQAIAWSGIGNSHFQLHQYSEALAAYQQALTLKQTLADTFGEAVALNNLSKVHHTLGNHDLAHSYQRESLTLKRRLTQSAAKLSRPSPNL